MINNKIFFLLPDGGGLRNFVYSDFYQKTKENKLQLVFWNNSSFPLKEKKNYEEVLIESSRTHPLTQIYSRAKKRIELNIFTKKFKDSVYQQYKFPLQYGNGTAFVKNSMISLLTTFFSHKKGLEYISKCIEKLERKTIRYKNCKAQLLEHKPNLVICSNQRNTLAIAPLLAAKDLNIKTACFIQSWDNVPKAMLVLDTDFYYVWSELMKRELLQHYPEISENQVLVTGTPQFEPHYNTSLIEDKKYFFKKYNLDLNKKYICYSGDDETTSALDQYYLEDLTNSVKELNKKGENLGIIFRRCPADFSDRFDTIIDNNNSIITSIDPIWKIYGNSTNSRFPQDEDYKLLANICYHSVMVTNVCSSTVFDFVIHKKPCIYYNYEQPQLKKGIRDIGQNYNYIHFRSMPSSDAVIFCESKKDLEKIINDVLTGKTSNVSIGTKWYHIIAGKEPHQSVLNFTNAVMECLR